VLVLYAHYTTRLSYYDDWLDAFRAAAQFDAVAIDLARAGAAARIKAELAAVDAIVLLHSTNADTLRYLDPHVATLAARRAQLLVFVGNEVNLPGSPIAEKRRVFAALQPQWIATQLLEEAGQCLFGDIAPVVASPHALNPAMFRPGPAQRAIDIGCRTATYLPHIGDEQRNLLVERFQELGAQGRLHVDISDAHYERPDWADFLARCRGTIATEAGSWYLERDDATVTAIRAYVRERTGGIVIANDSVLRTLGHRLPDGVRTLLRRLMRAGPLRHEAAVNETVPREEILARFFANKPRSPVYGKCISSRHFEAVGTKTCQIMVRGRFNDILQADRHYLALDADFGNLDAVLARFADDDARRAVVDAAYAHVTGAHTYAHRMRQVHSVLGAG
jgi:hypothetical protein